jgi:hypothetical protein
MQADWNRIGEAGFEFMMIESGVDQNDLQERENFWIDALDGMKHYNSCKAGHRRDLRFYSLDSVDTPNGNVRVGQGVWVNGREDEISKITKNRGKFSFSFLSGQFFYQNNNFIPMECE